MTDAQGWILWREGHAEHLVRAYHAWTGAAAPIHDPDTGSVIGAVDVTGPVRTLAMVLRQVPIGAAKRSICQMRTALSYPRPSCRGNGSVGPCYRGTCVIWSPTAAPIARAVVAFSSMPPTTGTIRP